jgi:N-acetylglucosamine kinase-like BadF-type ATPase
VARRILDRVADEVVAIVNATIRRLRLQRTDVEVILGGGMFRAGDPAFFTRARDGILDLAPKATIRSLDAPPVLGAALLGLDEIGAAKRAAARLRDDTRGLSLVARGPGRREPADSAMPGRRR